MSDHILEKIEEVDEIPSIEDIDVSSNGSDKGEQEPLGDRIFSKSNDPGKRRPISTYIPSEGSLSHSSQELSTLRGNKHGDQKNFNYFGDTFNLNNEMKKRGSKSSMNLKRIGMDFHDKSSELGGKNNLKMKKYKKMIRQLNYKLDQKNQAL